jgi:hypothetical protein
MANHGQDHLHRLIHAMTSTEKRYFKLHVGRTSGPGHSIQLLLFDAVAAMPVYDEAALLQRFAGEAFTHRFAVTKRRLYEAVLRSLDAFHNESSVDARLARSLHQVSILYDKALYEDALKMTHSVTRLARQYDRQPALLAALQWERRLVERDNYAHTDQDEVARINAEAAELRTTLDHTDRLWHIKSHLFMELYRQGQVRDADARQQVQQLLGDPLLTADPSSLAIRPRFLHHHVRSAAAFALGDAVQCREHLLHNRTLLLAERERFAEEPNLMLALLGNLAYVSAALGQSDEALAYLKEFRQVPADWNMAETDDLELKLFTTSMSLELSLHLSMGALQRADELLPAVERGLLRHGDRIGPLRRTGLLYLIAYVHFLFGRSAQALRWTNTLLGDLRGQAGHDVSLAARSLYLLLLLEQGKHDLLPYAVRNAERFLKAHALSVRSAKLVAGLVKNLARCAKPAEERPLLEEARAQCAALEQDPYERGVLEQLDLPAWLEARIQGRTPAEVITTRHDGVPS